MESYELLEECGRGNTATVCRALCIPFDGEECAVKRLHLESLGCGLVRGGRERAAGDGWRERAPLLAAAAGAASI